MLRRRAALLLATVVAVALLAALSSFAIGRDITPVAITVRQSAFSVLREKDGQSMMSNVRAATRALLALELLAPFPSFAIGRDLTPPRIATPDCGAGRPPACAHGTTADIDGVPRLPASAELPLPRRRAAL